MDMAELTPNVCCVLKKLRIIILWVLLMYQEISSYNIRCPHSSQRVHRAKKVCSNNPRQYSCLFDTNKRKYVEHCKIHNDYSAPGEKYVISGHPRNVKCLNTRFQPFSLWSNESSVCVFTKSFCNDEGQVIYNNGSIINDTSCRCDHTQGYVFVNQPKHQRYCVPSEEDCSCYKMHCPGGSLVDSDYRCIVHRSQLRSNCEVNDKYSASEDNKNDTKYSVPNGSNNKKEAHTAFYVGVPVTVLVALAFIIFLCIFLIFTYKPSMCNFSLFKCKPKKKIKIVAAIDLGKAYAVYAFSKVKSRRSNPMNTTPNEKWKDVFVEKKPSCVLLKENGEFVSLGSDAQSKYSKSLKNGDESTNYRYLEQFKMTLYKDNNISDDMEIEDFQQLAIKAKVVFSAVLKNLMGMVLESNKDLRMDDIQWVVTVPDVWSDKAIGFIRKCAEKACESSEKVMIVFESDAVLMYYLSKDPKDFEDVNYLVVDIGDGIVEVSAFNRTAVGELKELCEPFRLDSGVGTLHEEFLTILKKIVGEDVMKDLESLSKYRDGWFYLLKELKSLKHNIISGKLCQNSRIPLKIPQHDLDEICEKHHNQTFENVVKNSKNEENIEVRKNTLSFHESFIKKIFSGRIENAIKDIKTTIRSIEIKTVVLAGEFSALPDVKEKFVKHFPNIIPKLPEDADLIIAKGAVLYGHRPFVSSRISQYTFGRETEPIFDERLHERERCIPIDGIERCKGVFDILLKKNVTIKEVEIVTKKYKLDPEIQSNIRICMYRTKKEKVSYVDEEGCTLFAEAVVEVPNNKRQRTICVDFQFARTGSKVKAYDKNTKRNLNVVFTLK